MFSSPISYNEKDKKRLEDILHQYQLIAKSDPQILRGLIPPEEIWRFFVEAQRQTHGRFLKDEELFKKYLKEKWPAFLGRNTKKTVEKIAKEEQPHLDDWREGRIVKKLKERFWTLSDEQLKTITLAQIIELDKGWLPFEINETGYFEALYKAFQKAIDTSRPIDAAYVKELHRLATEKVENTGYQTDDEDVKNTQGTFRAGIQQNFGLGFGNTTIEGLKEFFARNHLDLFIRIEFYPGEENVLFAINHSLLAKLHHTQKNLLPYTDFFWNFPETKEEYALLSSDMERILDDFRSVKSDEEAAKLILEYMKDAKIKLSVKHKNNTEDISKYFNEILETYRNALKAAGDNPIEKLIAIISFVQQAEQLHPFADANCRTFCMLVLMHELSVHGFPLAILQDPNRFDCFSVSELLQEVLKGMENTFELIDKKQLFNISTDELFKTLRKNAAEHEFFANKLNYFEQVIAIEAEARLQAIPIPTYR